MPLYRYSARRLSGERVAGEAIAASRDELASRLSQDGLVLSSAKSLASGFSFGSVSHSRVSSKVMLTFISEFRALTSAGLPLAQALRRLETRKDSAALGAAVAAVRADVQAGHELTAAMAKHPDVFDPLTCATIEAGMSSGALTDALDQLLRLLRIKADLQRKVGRAMSYPLFMLVLLVVVLTVLMLFVLPQFADLYADFGAELPFLTQVLLSFVDWAPVIVPIAILLGFAGLFAGRALLRLSAVRQGFDRLRLSLPIVGPLRRDLMLVQISFILALMLNAGATLQRAVKVATDAIDDTDQAARLTRLGRFIQQGGSLGHGLQSVALYPPLSEAMLAAGEEAGDQGQMFLQVAQLHGNDLNDRLARVVSLIEPAMMLFVGLVLGTVIIAVYLPIFALSAVVQ